LYGIVKGYELVRQLCCKRRRRRQNIAKAALRSVVEPQAVRQV